MKPHNNIQDAFDFGESNNLHKNTNNQITETKISLDDELKDRLIALLDKHTDLTDSAVNAHKEMEKNKKIRTGVKYVGNTVHTLLAGAAIAYIPSLASDMEQFNTVKSAFEMKSLLSGAMGGISEQAEKLVDILQENYAGVIRFGGWQTLLIQGKGVWNNFFDKTLGAYASGGEKMDTASVLAAYERISIPFFDKKGELYGLDSIKAEITAFTEEKHNKNPIEIAHFLRGAGILSHDHYQDILLNKLTESVNLDNQRQLSTGITMAMAPNASAIADVLYKSFHFETDRRKSVPIINKFIKKELFTEDEYKRMQSFMGTCHALDDGGLHKTRNNIDSFQSRDLIADHILNSLLSEDRKATQEIIKMINMTEKAITNLNLEVEPDAIHKAYMPSTKQNHVNNLGSEAIQLLTDVKEQISNSGKEPSSTNSVKRDKRTP